MYSSRNEEIAASVMYYDKTVALMRGNTTDENMEKIKKLLSDNGWYAYEIENEDFKSKGGEDIGSVTMICDAKSVPLDMQDSIERYLVQNGRLFIFGGPLFGNTDITKETMHLEGVSPLYKTFRENNCDKFELLSQEITKANFSGGAPYFICPNARPDGGGFGMDRRCRMLPVISIKKENGRDNGRRGSAAFFMISDSVGRMPFVHGTRLGNVSPTTRGNVVAVIGTALNNVFAMNGEDVIVDMTKALLRGTFLFEAGATKYVSKPDEKVNVGAKIFSAARDYCELTIRFNINGIIQEKTVLASGQNYTEISAEYAPFNKGVYNIRVELLCDGNVIDAVESELVVTTGKHSSDKNDFVTVSDGKFMLNNKRWDMFGMNYFPSYQVSLELNDYWRGEFDKSVYIQSEIDKDLAHIKELGMNTVAVRVEGNCFDNIIDPIKDFLYRCDKYGLKVMFGYCNITNPLYFDEKAVAEFMKLLDISDDPTIMAYDVFWESGGEFAEKRYARRFSPEWEKWLIKQYGSIAEAEKSFGTSLERTEFGDILCPTKADYMADDEKNKLKLTAFTRFMTDMVSHKWSKAIRILKKYDDNHLYTNRMGLLDNNIPNVFISSVAKHFDFMSLEAYPLTQDEYGYFASVALDSVARYVSGGKPVIWAEYGINLGGISGDAHGTKILWDGEQNGPLDSSLEKQRAYQEQFNRVFRQTGACGTLPWFYWGGFRFTEHSDCGYVSPNGENRPVMDEYLKNSEWFNSEIPERKVSETIIADPEDKTGSWYKFVYGEGTFSKYEFDKAELLGDTNFTGNRVAGLGIQAAERADKEGAVFDFKTPGDGTTSADVPLVLCGGAEFKGNGPLKYMNGEFNYITMSDGDKTYIIEDGMNIKLKSGKYQVNASVGNIAPAKWIAGENKGCVVVKFGDFSLSMDNDVSYLEDGNVSGTIELTKSERICIRLESVERAQFGEKIEINVDVI